MLAKPNRAQTARFPDRRAAGRALAARLAPYRTAHPVLLALPRGGVPVAAPVAEALDCPLNLLLVRKIPAPGNPELGLGALVDGDPPVPVMNDAMVQATGATAAHIAAAIAAERVELERRRARYAAAPVSVDGRTVILVDDGIATGGTMRAALAGLRAAGARQLVVAVPVAAADALSGLRDACDAIVCLRQPEPFHAVGAHYDDFTQTSDAEVVALLARHGVRPPPDGKDETTR